MRLISTLTLASCVALLAGCSSSGGSGSGSAPIDSSLNPVKIENVGVMNSDLTCGIVAVFQLSKAVSGLGSSYDFKITSDGKTTDLPGGTASNITANQDPNNGTLYEIPPPTSGSIKLGVPVSCTDFTSTYSVTLTNMASGKKSDTKTYQLGPINFETTWAGKKDGSAKLNTATNVVEGKFDANATNKKGKAISYSFKLSGTGTVTHKKGSDTFTITGAKQGETVTITAHAGHDSIIGKAIPVTAENILAVNADVKTSAVTQVNLSNPGKADGVDQFATIDLSAKTLAVTQNANAQGYYLTNGNLTAKTYSQYASLINTLKKPVSLQLTAKSLADADAVTQAASLLTNAQDVVVIPVTAKNIADVATAASKLQAQHLGFVLQLPLGDHAATCDLLNSIAPYMKSTSYRGIYLQPVGDVDMSSIALVNQFLQQPSVCKAK